MDLNTVTKVAEIKGEQFPVVDIGAGPAVLLLHGFPDSRFLWRAQAPALAAAGLRALAPDLLGFGEAPRPVDVRPYRQPFLLEPQMAQSGETVDRPWRYERLAGAGHWVMLDQPEEINRLLIEFLSAP